MTLNEIDLPSLSEMRLSYNTFFNFGIVILESKAICLGYNN